MAWRFIASPQHQRLETGGRAAGDCVMAVHRADLKEAMIDQLGNLLPRLVHADAVTYRNFGHAESF
jgi:hypothetical protein